MRHGRFNKIFFFIFIYWCNILFAEENIKIVPLINLDELPATFEEEKEFLEKKDKFNELPKNNKTRDFKFDDGDKNIYVNLKALDKITAKTSSIKIAIGKKKQFGKLEIKPLTCKLSDVGEAPDTVAYIQVKDLSAKNKNQVFIFNGWTFASSPTLRSIDHPVYDLWLVSCENV